MGTCESPIRLLHYLLRSSSLVKTGSEYLWVVLSGCVHFRSDSPVVQFLQYRTLVR